MIRNTKQRGSGETDAIPLQWHFDWQSDGGDAASILCLSWGLTKTQADPLLQVAAHDGHAKPPAHHHEALLKLKGLQRTKYLN